MIRSRGNSFAKYRKLINADVDTPPIDQKRMDQIETESRMAIAMRLIAVILVVSVFCILVLS